MTVKTLMNLTSPIPHLFCTMISLAGAMGQVYRASKGTQFKHHEGNSIFFTEYMMGHICKGCHVTFWPRDMLAVIVSYLYKREVVLGWQVAVINVTFDVMTYSRRCPPP